MGLCVGFMVHASEAFIHANIDPCIIGVWAVGSLALDMDGLALESDLADQTFSSGGKCEIGRAHV